MAHQSGKGVGAHDNKAAKPINEFKKEYGELGLDDYGESSNVGDTNSKQRK